MKTEKEFLKEYVKNKLIYIIGIPAMIFLLGFVASIFIWIWGNSLLAMRVGITGLIGYFILSFIWHYLKKVISDSVDKYLEDEKEIKPRFHDRLHKVMEELKKK